MLSMLGEAALRTVFLAVIVQCFLSACRVRRARALLAVWTIVLAASLTMPLLLRSRPLNVPLDDIVSTALLGRAADLLQDPPFQTPMIVAADTRGPVGPWLAIIYLIVGCILGVRVLLGVGLSWWIVVRAKPCHPAEAVGSRIKLSRDVAVPVTIGRVIVLPADSVDWTAETRQAVLAHERAHVGRCDYAMLIVSQLNRAVFWFSPLPWWLHRRLVMLAEIASDDQAIAITGDRLGYAEILLQFGRRSTVTPSGPSMARLSTLSYRIDRILLDQLTPGRIGGPGLVVVILGLTATALVTANLAVETVAPSALSDLSALLSKEDVPQRPLLEPGPTIVAQALNPDVKETRALRHQIRPVPAPAKAVTGLPSRTKRQTVESISNSPARAIAQPDPDIMIEKVTATAGTTLTIPRAIATERKPPDNGFFALAGRKCAGTVSVGTRDYTERLPSQPNVRAGQIVPASAQFFRKSDGSPWVRFSVFDRPPLDLSVRLSRNGASWTGEYGITYAVQTVDERRLIGLAARIANDSAKLGFSCITSPLT